jgi:general secretion pathway protein D
MKTVPLSASVLAVLAAALLGALAPVQPAFAQNQTDAKIRLMSEALRARDAGDLAGAQQALSRLATLSPNDPAVQKLRS